MTDLQEIKEILDDGNFELVSYGLAPNPNGFCYEFIGEKRNKKQEKRLNDLLSSLDDKEELILKRMFLWVSQDKSLSNF